MRNVLVLFPGALGDFVCALPAFLALRRDTAAHLTIAAKPSLVGLLPHDIERFSIDRREVADLFATAPLSAATRSLFSRFSHIHSWTGSGDPSFAQRLRAASGAIVWAYPFRGMQEHEHATRYYARCVGALVDRPSLAIDPRAHAWANSLLPMGAYEDALLIHPGSGSPKKNWTGFAPLAERWRAHGRVVWITGPADHRIDTPDGDACVRDQPLSRIAALLHRAPLFVGNDSGISHLAGAVGAHGLALFGPTDPSVWQPLGLHLLFTPDQCTACTAAVFCTHRLAVEAVHTILRALLPVRARLDASR